MEGHVADAPRLRCGQVVARGEAAIGRLVAGKTAGKSVTEQTQDILATIDGHLAKAGTDKSKLLSATIYITDMKTFAEMNAVWDGWVSAGNTPARATVEAKLAAPQYNVEIMVVAAKVILFTARSLAPDCTRSPGHFHLHLMH